jgi:hypothetical protein
MMQRFAWVAVCLVIAAASSVVHAADLPPGTCDQGSATTQPMPVVAAAGFTHCVLNADFTQTGGFFSNVSNFVDGCGATGVKIFQAYYAYSGTPVPCNRMTIENDGGTQVLHLQYLHGDSVATTYIRPLEFAYSTLDHHGGVQSGWPQPNSPGSDTLPQEMYAEITFRMPQYSLDQGQLGRDIPFAWWQMGAAGSASPTGVEIDYIEINSDSNGGSGWLNGTGMRDWCSGGTGCGDFNQPINTWVDYTQYHKFGVLVTSDEATNFAKCLFVDDVLQGCQHITPKDATSFHTNRALDPYYLAVWIGNNGGDNDPNLYESINPVDVYIKSERIWECGAYTSSTTATCAGSTWVDNGHGLTYWKP